MNEELSGQLSTMLRSPYGSQGGGRGGGEWSARDARVRESGRDGARVACVLWQEKMKLHRCGSGSSQARACRGRDPLSAVPLLCLPGFNDRLSTARNGGRHPSLPSNNNNNNWDSKRGEDITSQERHNFYLHFVSIFLFSLYIVGRSQLCLMFSSPHVNKVLSYACRVQLHNRTIAGQLITHSIEKSQLKQCTWKIGFRITISLTLF